MQINDKKVKEHFNKVAKLHENDNAVLDSNNSTKSKHANIYHHYSSLKAIKNQIPINTQQTIIDFGCGTGRFFPHLSKSFKKVIATDISDEMLQIARLKAQKYNNVEVIAYNDFNNKDLKADLAYTFWVLAHCSDEQIRIVFKRINEILNSNGYFYIFEQISKNGRILSDIHYQRAIDDYIRLAKEFGFKCEKTKNLIRFPSYARSIWSKMPSWCRFLLPFLYFIETTTLNRKPEFIEYFTSLMVFKKE